MLPIAYAAASVLVVMGVLLVLADIVNPIRLRAERLTSHRTDKDPMTAIDLGMPAAPPPVLAPRRKTRQIKVGKVLVGGDAPVSVQSMTTTLTSDVNTTLQQIAELTASGCDIVRVACPSQDDADALPEIAQHSQIPVIADIHFQPKYVFAAIDAGCAAVRVNPGNIRKFDDQVKEIAAAAKDRGTSIRIGVNAGSLDPRLLEKYGKATPEALVESAVWEASLFEEHDFHDFKISVKHNDPVVMVRAYELLVRAGDWPLHLGVTEAGPAFQGTIKSSVAFGALLAKGIGDTIRVSLSAPPVEEVKVGLQILESLNLRPRRLEIVSCPSCGRAQVDVYKLADEVTAGLEGMEVPLRVAVMGCVVNGPGEAREADLGVASGNGKGQIFVKGEVIKTVPESLLLGVRHLQHHRLARARAGRGAGQELRRTGVHLRQLPEARGLHGQGPRAARAAPRSRAQIARRRRQHPSLPAARPGPGFPEPHSAAGLRSSHFRSTTAVTGALLRIKPGGMRELHWHPNADEWQYYIKGRGRMTVFGSHGRARTEEFAAGDVGYVPQGYGHYIENVGTEDLEVVLALNNGSYEFDLHHGLDGSQPGSAAGHQLRRAAERACGLPQERDRHAGVTARRGPERGDGSTLPRSDSEPTWPLPGQLRARRDARSRRQMEVADLHPIRRKHRRRVVAVVVDHKDRAGPRHDGDDRLAVPHRRKRPGEAAAILLVDQQRERNARHPRLTRPSRGMMGVPAQDLRLALTLPGAAQVGNRGHRSLGSCGRRERGEHDDPSDLRHVWAPPGRACNQLRSVGLHWDPEGVVSHVSTGD